MYLLGFQPRQSFADGADDLDRVRRRRRDRDDREHHPLRRSRRSPLGGRAQGVRADRLHHRFAHRLLDRGSYPALVHGRCGRPPVSRIRGHARRHDRHFSDRFAHARADALRASDPASSGAQRETASTSSRREPSMRWSRIMAGRSKSCCGISRSRFSSRSPRSA